MVILKTLIRLMTVGLLALSALQAQAEDHIVEVITDLEEGIMRFHPKHLTIKPGDTVTWVNKMDDLHNMITYPDGYPQGAQGFKSPYLERAGETWSYTFKEQGSYNYHCIPHIMMGMRGTIVVGSPSAPAAMNNPTTAEINVYRDELLAFFDSDDFDTMPNMVKRNLSKQ